MPDSMLLLYSWDINTQQKETLWLDLAKNCGFNKVGFHVGFEAFDRDLNKLNFSQIQNRISRAKSEPYNFKVNLRIILTPLDLLKKFWGPNKQIGGMLNYILWSMKYDPNVNPNPLGPDEDRFRSTSWINPGEHASKTLNIFHPEARALMRYFCHELTQSILTWNHKPDTIAIGWNRNWETDALSNKPDDDDRKPYPWMSRAVKDYYQSGINSIISELIEVMRPLANMGIKIGAQLGSLWNLPDMRLGWYRPKAETALHLADVIIKPSWYTWSLPSGTNAPGAWNQIACFNADLCRGFSNLQYVVNEHDTHVSRTIFGDGASQVFNNLTAVDSDFTKIRKSDNSPFSSSLINNYIIFTADDSNVKAGSYYVTALSNNNRVITVHRPCWRTLHSSNYAGFVNGAFLTFNNLTIAEGAEGNLSKVRKADNSNFDSSLVGKFLVFTADDENIRAGRYEVIARNPDNVLTLYNPNGQCWKRSHTSTYSGYFENVWMSEDALHSIPEILQECNQMVRDTAIYSAQRGIHFQLLHWSYEHIVKSQSFWQDLNNNIINATVLTPSSPVEGYGEMQDIYNAWRTACGVSSNYSDVPAVSRPVKIMRLDY